MNLEELQKGDVIYAAVTVANDGSVPGAGDDEVFAQRGTRGMLINIGHLEEDPNQTLYLVAFENEQGDLGPPVACLPEELCAEGSAPAS